jgi:hypothetical protein
MANTFELIQAYTVGSGGQASIDFTVIPSTYTDLCVLVSGRSSYAGGSATLFISLNGSTSSFTSKIIEGSGSTVVSFSSARNIGVINGATSTANTFANMSIYIPNYAGATNKSFSTDSVQETNATEAYADLTANLWANTAAINQITLTPGSGNFVQYSTAYLYGVKNA